MANPLESMGLTPGSGNEAMAFATSMDKAAEASKKLTLESSKSYQNMLNQLDVTNEITKKAKKKEKVARDSLELAKSELKALQAKGIQGEKLQKAMVKMGDLANVAADYAKETKKAEQGSFEIAQEKLKLDRKITEQMKKHQKFASLMNVGLGILVTLVTEALTRQTDLRKEMGLTVAQSEKLLPIVQDVTSELSHQGIDFAKSSAAASALYDSTKSFAEVTKENVANIALISQKFGIAVTDTAKIAETMKQIGGYSIEQSTNMITFASAAAEAAGIAPADVMADIAKSSETAAKYFGDNPKELAKAAIEARRLGLTLDDMADVSKGLLDIETSIEAQFEAQVLTGKQFNFDQARRLALSGDIEGATKAILGQMGSIDEFNQMDVFQKEAVAKAAGLTVTQLSESLTKQKGLAEMTREEKEEYEELLGKMEKGNQSDAQKLLDQAESQLLQEQFTASMTQLKEILVKSIMPTFMMVADFVKDILGGITDTTEKMNNFATIIKGIVISYGLIKAYTTWIAIKEAVTTVQKMQQGSLDARAVFLGNSKVAQMAAQAAAWAIMNPWLAIGGLVLAATAGALIYSTMSSAPKAAEGGVTTGPTMAMVGDNPSGKEAIIPLEKAGEMGFGGSNRELVAKIDELINVVKTAKPINIDGAKVGEAVYLGSIQSGAA